MVEEREDNLAAALKEFDVASIGRVACEFGGGKVAPANGLTHDYVLVDVESVVSVGERLHDLGYSGSATSSGVSYTRPDGILVQGNYFSDLGERGSSILDSYCDGVPIPSNAVLLHFEERPN